MKLITVMTVAIRRATDSPAEARKETRAHYSLCALASVKLQQLQAVCCRVLSCLSCLDDGEMLLLLCCRHPKVVEEWRRQHMHAASSLHLVWLVQQQQLQTANALACMRLCLRSQAALSPANILLLALVSSLSLSPAIISFPAAVAL